jgi:hypothetical protein
MKIWAFALSVDGSALWPHSSDACRFGERVDRIGLVTVSFAIDYISLYGFIKDILVENAIILSIYVELLSAF